MTDNSFFSNVDSMVLEAINSNPSSFNEILTMLPGIYPSQVKDSIIRLGKSEFLPSSVISVSPNLSSTKTIQSSTKTMQSLSYIPHPLDYDWRFHDSTKKLLIENLIYSLQKMILLFYWELQVYWRLNITSKIVYYYWIKIHQFLIPIQILVSSSVIY